MDDKVANLAAALADACCPTVMTAEAAGGLKDVDWAAVAKLIVSLISLFAKKP